MKVWMCKRRRHLWRFSRSLSGQAGPWKIRRCWPWDEAPRPSCSRAWIFPVESALSSAPPCTFLQYHYLMSHFVCRFWVLKTGPHFLRGWAARVIRKVWVLCYELTGVTLAWEDGQWVEAHKIILSGSSPKKSTPTIMFELNGSYSDVQKKKRKRQAGLVSGCPKFVLWRRQLKRGAGNAWL